MSTPNPRKRPAPGAAPILPVQQQVQASVTAGNGSGDQMVKWNGADNFPSFMDNSAQSGGYDIMQSVPQYAPGLSTPSTSLTRRPIMNGALIPANARPAFDGSSSWGYNDGSLVPKVEDDVGEQDDVEALEEMAQRAKRDAQGKRKQIPPFVQKLSR